LAEKIRSGRAEIPSFFTSIGVGTLIENGDFIMIYKEGNEEPQIVSEINEKRVFNEMEWNIFYGDRYSAIMR
jgi:acyl CoA:acetate/3-ketoacid CoA transferase alpha subunit